MPEDRTRLYFELFNEIGIIEQLSRTMLEARLPDGLIAPHFIVLNHLVRVGDGRAPMDMARAFQVPKTSLAHTLKILEARGLVDLRPNPEDGRSKRVWITDAGRRLREETITALAPDVATLAEAFAPTEVERVLPVLRALRIELDAARDPKAAAVRPSAPRQRAI